MGASSSPHATKENRMKTNLLALALALALSATSNFTTAECTFLIEDPSDHRCADGDLWFDAHDCTAPDIGSASGEKYLAEPLGIDYADLCRVYSNSVTTANYDCQYAAAEPRHHWTESTGGGFGIDVALSDAVDLHLGLNWDWSKIIQIAGGCGFAKCVFALLLPRIKSTRSCSDLTPTFLTNVGRPLVL